MDSFQSMWVTQLSAYLCELFQVNSVARMVSNDWKTSSEAWEHCIFPACLHLHFFFSLEQRIHVFHVSTYWRGPSKQMQTWFVCVNSGKEGRNRVWKTRGNSVCSLTACRSCISWQEPNCSHLSSILKLHCKAVSWTHQHWNVTVGNKHRSRYTGLDSAVKRKKKRV